MDNRINTYEGVKAELSAQSDERLLQMLASGKPLGSSIGGTAVSLEVNGVTVFAKKVRLTDIERQPNNVHSTANLFGLPTYFQYGIGSAGFSAWRELAAHNLTTSWVLSGKCSNFPLIYHWRILPDVPTASTPKTRKELESSVDYWEGSSAVRARLEAIQDASASLVLFLENLPETLNSWLNKQMIIGGDQAELAIRWVEKELLETVDFMGSQDFLHFDAHFENIMTDGQRLYFGDFGLAISSHFELSKDEAEFFKHHHSYDRCYVIAHLVNWLMTAQVGKENRNAVIEEYALGQSTKRFIASVEKIMKHHAPLVAIANQFFRRLQNETRKAEYPASEIERKMNELVV